MPKERWRGKRAFMEQLRRTVSYRGRLLGIFKTQTFANKAYPHRRNRRKKLHRRAQNVHDDKHRCRVPPIFVDMQSIVLCNMILLCSEIPGANLNTKQLMSI
ncbi:uncharacterized protein LOC128201528 [Galleria mellonella]|uniref:Uncharacterized protein LOC128201528 n=1 Tax=Galleria mellonella TaxID=7137 RepID=A0ABM3MTP1_GALME|nr:uncharacterized protein LOC128201528 [Galleria mellonella]